MTEEKTNQNTLQGFAVSENERIQNERTSAMSELGYAPFFKMEEGTHIIEFVDQLPRENALYPDRSIFRIRVAGEEWDYSINRKSPLYRDIVRLITDGILLMVITRIGKGRTDTRYKVEADK